MPWQRGCLHTIALQKLSSAGEGGTGAALTHKKEQEHMFPLFHSSAPPFSYFLPNTELFCTICRDSLPGKFCRAFAAGIIDIALHARIASIELA